MSLESGPIKHDIAYITAETETEYKSQYEPAKYIPYLALTGELWVVFCEDSGENWASYNDTALCIISFHQSGYHTLAYVVVARLGLFFA